MGKIEAPRPIQRITEMVTETGISQQRGHTPHECRHIDGYWYADYDLNGYPNANWP